MNLTDVQRDPALEATLSRYMSETPRQGPVYAFQEVASTMDVAHALAQEGAVEGTLIWAQRQAQGRGRLGRVWESPAGGIYCSLIVRPQRPAAEIPQLSLIAGLSVLEVIRECTTLAAQIRWPNDVLIGGKKVAGILSEGAGGGRRGAGDGTTNIVIGIGINVTSDPAQLPPTATSLLAAGGKHLDTFHLTARLYRRFFRWYDVWISQRFSPIREALRPWLALLGEVVHIRSGSEAFEGTASDLDEFGRLVVRLDSGVMKPFEVGEVHLLESSIG